MRSGINLPQAGRTSFERAEEDRLTREISRLEHRLAKIRAARAGVPQRRAADADARRRRFRTESYSAYIFDLIRGTEAFGLWERLLVIFRRFRLISTVIRVSTAVFAILQTGAFFIVIGGILLTLFPLIAAFFILAFVRSLLTLRQRGRKLKSVISGNNICIFFFPRSFTGFDTAEETARIISDTGQTVILVSSPRKLKLSGFRPAGVFRISRFDYFFFNPRVLRFASERTDIFI